MHGTGLAHAVIGPRDGLTEVEVHFEDGAAIAPAREVRRVPSQLQPTQAQNLARGEVHNDRIGWRQLAQVGDLASGMEAGMVGAEEVKEGVDKSTGAALHHGPAAGHP